MKEAKLIPEQQAVTNIVSKTEEVGSRPASKEEREGSVQADSQSDE
jgi:hypothetical protein